MECTKVKFANEKFALEWIDKINKTSHRRIRPIRAYLCYNCGAWHLTSKISGEETLNQKQKAKIKELESVIKEKDFEIQQLKTEIKNYNKKVNKALNISNRDLANSAGFKKEEQQNAFLYGCNKMRELIKSLIK